RRQGVQGRSTQVRRNRSQFRDETPATLGSPPSLGAGVLAVSSPEPSTGGLSLFPWNNLHGIAYFSPAFRPSYRFVRTHHGGWLFSIALRRSRHIRAVRPQSSAGAQFPGRRWS